MKIEGNHEWSTYGGYGAARSTTQYHLLEFPSTLHLRHAIRSGSSGVGRALGDYAAWAVDGHRREAVWLPGTTELPHRGFEAEK